MIRRTSNTQICKIGVGLAANVAIVTEAASGTIYGLRISLLKEDAKVVFSDINKSSKAAAEADGINALLIKCDISNAESVKNLVESTFEVFGTINIDQ
jgi:3-hydroxybutyrate dehydrogenase